MKQLSDRTSALLVRQIKNNVAAIGRKLKILEVCGTHTVSIYKYGLPAVFGQEFEFVSGPGCPVCVTHQHYIDQLIELSDSHTIFTFGDMLKVPGSCSSLAQARANGADIRIMYSPPEAVVQAASIGNSLIAAVGFETTAPAFGLAIKMASERKLKNVFFVNELKTMPAPIQMLMANGLSTDGILLPGHVAAVIGVNGFEFMRNYQVPCIIAGFTGLDILISLYRITQHLLAEPQQGCLINQYSRVVSTTGNPTAQALVAAYYEPCDAYFRGIGIIKAAGLRLRPQLQQFEISCSYPPEAPSQCRCAQVITAQIQPRQCPLFANCCTPESPQGPCMVSSEGACAAYYRYAREGLDINENY